MEFDGKNFENGMDIGYKYGKLDERARNFDRMMKLKAARKRREKQIWDLAVDEVLQIVQYIDANNESIKIGYSQGEEIEDIDDFLEEILICEKSLKEAFAEKIEELKGGRGDERS